MFKFKRTFAVIIHKSEYSDFVKIMENDVKRYKVDKCQVGDDVVWSITISEFRYKKMLEVLPRKGLNVVVYANTLTLHEIRK